MKRVSRFFAKLYPSSWRDRYGVEFDELLEDTKPTGRDAFDVFKGALTMQMTKGTFLKTLVAFAVAGAILAVATSFAMPVRYQSVGVLKVLAPSETRAIQVTSARNQAIWNEIEELRQEVVKPKSLFEIIQRRNLYTHERSRMPVDDIVALMAKNILVRPVTSSDPVSRFTIEFNYGDALMAQKVALDLMARFIDHSVRNDTTAEYLSRPRKMRLEPLELASLPLKPMSPNKPWIGTLGLFVGLLTGLTWALIRRSRRGTAA
jgi:hypothetical protein